jgi:ATP-binding cassette subfamily C (CFTR/MRP) protein 10
MTATGKEMTATGKEMTATDKTLASVDSKFAAEEQIQSQFKLDDISMVVKPGQLVGVVGKVGSGKTSLLAALTAEINKFGGSVSVGSLERGISLVTQTSWIQHATLRDNILFGREYNAEFYQNVIHACALEPDLQILPAGDMTEVGENGVTLSGGQKLRVALARAVYQDKPLYLLDDPFAAVDAHVATHIFNYTICGLLKNKTRILCTHHTRFLQKADLVIGLEDGRIANIGPPEIVLPQVQPASPDKMEDEADEKQGEKATIEATLDPVSKDEGGSVLVEEEQREVDVIKPHVYWSYFTSIGFILAPTIFIFLFLMEASKDVTNWWLAYWVSTFRYVDATSLNVTAFNVSPPIHTHPHSQLSPLPAFNVTPSGSNLYFYIGIYLGLAVANSIFALFRAFLFAYGGLCAARVLHTQLLKSILRAPVVFFDTNPVSLLQQLTLFFLSFSLFFLVNFSYTAIQ